MLITVLEDLVGKEVEIMVGGHFFIGRITSVDPTGIVVFADDEEPSRPYTIDAEHVQLVQPQ